MDFGKIRDIVSSTRDYKTAGAARVLVANVDALDGIEIPKLSCVINYDIPHPTRYSRFYMTWPVLKSVFLKLSEEPN